MDIGNTWKDCLDFIERKIGRSTYDLWFKPIKLLELKDNAAILSVPNRFFREWIEDNYPRLISDAFEWVMKDNINVQFKVDHEPAAPASDSVKKDALTQARKAKLANLAGKGIFLNPKYIFETFVVGPSNQFVHAAALAVSESLGKTYNPLFIYGDVGLGKTHIITAIGNKVADMLPNANVIYVSSEQFTNEVVSAIRHEKMSDLKEKYRTVDILLLDDVQFIANKTQTQVEFFHTFNALYEKQKQIVISSDRPPKELSDITDRLKSRFTMGLIADIQPPSVELKMAILQKKAEAHKINMPEDMVYFLATKIKSNIRELEGCLIKLAAHSNLTGRPINVSLAKEVLKDIFTDETKPVTTDNIQKVVCDYFGVKLPELKSKKRTKEIAMPRQTAMYITKKLTDMSLGDIGKAFGGKDHATVIYACKQIEAKMEKDEAFNKTVEYLINKIKP
ncbi:chromosomal replication initiator protein DnaA [Candidatus Magnetominusculus xianensis]|uniref:Chromosomal replication initiator protein DnaA n=1 Tax=Candidatus Magnetominusculus xianensis TaxID=1748249 RepID=A0ABR5SEH9_9BACT|nr:chromosomal replication initiator protein DnaA [Candidatus Magnetominusculus xianensis]KWT84427.1 chromosomal replication initiator protein DnaA [Candidatus Magnetominusculus xianensis]MBF0404261.1 chromosomal replication initiator protein DnaA [Nitrospirota bacterium]